MNIFGFTITRTSKRKRDEDEVEIFEKCVDTLDKVTALAKHIVQSEPSLDTVQSLGEAQEHLESLIDIYNRNKFSRPSYTFTLSKIIHEMRALYANYVTAASQRARLLSEIEKLKDVHDTSYDMYGMNFKSHLKKASEQAYHACMRNLNLAAKEYFASLNAIRFTIIYDITRVALGVDIIKQYHETKGYTVPEKGLEYTVRFKTLSRDEINEQFRSNKEGEDNESDRNGI